jgi:hypothetical protein
MFEGVDAFDGGEEPDALAVMFDGLDAIAVARWVLARAWAADQDDIARVLQKRAAVKLSRQRLLDLAAGEVEAGDAATVRETGGLELVGRRSHLPIGHLGLQELREDRQRGLEGRRALLGQLANGLSHPVHLQAA